MKLIEAEKAKDVIHEYFKSLMVNGASGTGVDRLAVGIGSCLKHDANLLKAIDELPSAEPDTTTHDSILAETGKNDGDGTSGDCISRTQAIDWIHGDADWLASQGSDWQVERMERDKSILMSLPSAQPERKTGRWIPVSERLPDDLAEVNVTWINHKPEPYYDFTKDKPFTASAVYYKGDWYWYSSVCADLLAEYGKNEIDEIDGAIEITAWLPLPEPYQGGEQE